MMTPEQLTGQSADHIVAIDEPACEVNAGVRKPLLEMITAAREAGIDLAPASSFRTFERQLTIWNRKFSGQRPLYDASGRTIDALSLSPEDRVSAIMIWSAVPGASRHHWGTDLDLIDRLAIPPEYRVQLVAAEFETGGPFAKLADWLEKEARRFGFFNPYRGVLSGVAPEPWHWSYAPIAEAGRALLTPAILSRAIENAPLLGKECLLDRIPELHARFVQRIDPPAGDVSGLKSA
jgi:LAS superfamily LD-carboxypeptidase LdcB